MSWLDSDSYHFGSTSPNFRKQINLLWRKMIYDEGSNRGRQSRSHPLTLL